MITAVDTSVLIDIFGADARSGPGSKALLKRCLNEGQVLACAPVVCEVVAAFEDSKKAVEALGRPQIAADALDAETAFLAGDVFREYRRRGGKRDRVVAGFLIGAHAALRADRLLTRDRGFHRAFFADLPILDPSPACKSAPSPGVVPWPSRPASSRSPASCPRSGPEAVPLRGRAATRW